MVLLDKLLPKLRSQGHRVLLFSQMVRMLDIIQDYLTLKGYSFERIDGGVKINERQAAICHRIGQDKAVKVYRLITNRTYEMEMFQRANLKLGLDKAVLNPLKQNITSDGRHDVQVSE